MQDIQEHIKQVQEAQIEDETEDMKRLAARKEKCEQKEADYKHFPEWVRWTSQVFVKYEVDEWRKFAKAELLGNVAVPKFSDRELSMAVLSDQVETQM